MNNAFKHSLPALAPPRLRRLAPTLAMAFATLALNGAHALAQGTGNTLGGRATAVAADSLNWGAVATVILYLIAAFAVIAGVVGIWQMGKRNQQVSPMLPICAFLAAFIAAGSGTLILLGSTTVTGAAPSITGADTQKLTFR